MTNVLERMFPHTMRLYRIYWDDREPELALTQRCSLQMNGIQVGTENSYKLLCPVIDTAILDNNRQRFRLEVDISGVTKKDGRIYTMDNNHLYTIAGVKVGCQMDVKFDAQTI